MKTLDELKKDVCDLSKPTEMLKLSQELIENALDRMHQDSAKLSQIQELESALKSILAVIRERD